MFIINYFKSKAAQARRIRELDATVELLSSEVVRIGDLSAAQIKEIYVLKTDIAHYKRVIGGYKGGQTRRENQEEAK